MKQRLDKFLGKYFKTMPKSLIYKGIRKKRIKINGKKGDINTILKVGDKITIWGTRSDYKGDAQVGGPAYFVEKHSGETVSVDDVEVNDIYVMNRMVVADGEFSIFTIAGQNVTAMNGTLANGVYIVKTTNSAVKVVVK